MTRDGNRRPNVLVVMSDDHGRWANGCYGNSEVGTPTLDHLAASGVKFANAFTPSPVCSPARASFWTGRYPSQHGIHDFLGQGSETNDWTKDEVSLAQILHDDGYITGLSGKWHLGREGEKAPGFDFWYSQSLKTRLPNGFESPWSDVLPPTGRDIPAEAPGHVLATERGYDPNGVTDHAVQFMRARDRSQPFFLFVGYIATHSFWSGHADHLVNQYRGCTFRDIPDDTMYPFGRLEVEATFPTRENPQEALAQYYAAVSEVDTGMRRLLDELATQAILEETIVVYASDHGLCCGHHGLWGKGNATRPLNMLEENIRIPLLVNWPGHILGGQTRLEVVDHCDLFQTLLDMAKVELDPGIRQRRNYPGRSFAASLFGHTLGEWKDAMFGEYGNLRMIRTDRFKLVRRYPDGPDELFDLHRDPRETKNELPNPGFGSVVVELSQRLEKWFSQIEDPHKSGLHVRDLPRHNTEEAWRDLK